MFTKTILDQYRHKLIHEKTKLLNELHHLDKFFFNERQPGDEMDACVRVQEEHRTQLQKTFKRKKLLAIESALARLDRGSFGVCEITGEPIEIERLKIMPWTAHSSEGAEIAESININLAQP